MVDPIRRLVFLSLKAIRVVEFSRVSGGVKLKKILPKNQHKYPKEIFEF